MIQTPLGVLAVLTSIAALFFYLEHKTKWKVFVFLPPLLWIYSLPVVLTNTGILPSQSDVYTWMSNVILPVCLILLLLNVDIKGAFRILGRGILVMFMGTLGVMIGAPIAYWIVRSRLSADGWKAFGTLSGSWIGGTGNMAAVAQMIETGGTEFGLAVLADNAIYIAWMPLMLSAKAWAVPFAKWTGADPNRIKELAMKAGESKVEKEPLAMTHLLYLLGIAITLTWFCTLLSEKLPPLPPVLTASTWKILLITTFGLALSTTRASRIPASYELAMALIYIFVANMGARAALSGLAEQGPWFILGAAIWIIIHGLFCVLGAKLFKSDIHTTVLASAVNIGGVASAPIVAAYHHKSLVPVSILMALICYAIANYAGWLTAILCRMVA